MLCKTTYSLAQARAQFARAARLKMHWCACMAVVMVTLTPCLVPAATAPVRRSAHVIDGIMPAPHLRDVHQERVRGSARDVYAAIRQVTPAEVRGLVPLMAARGYRVGREDRAMLRQPLLRLLPHADFVLLGERPGKEIVIGAIGQFWANRSVPLRSRSQYAAHRDPRQVRLAISVRVVDLGDNWSRVVTETRAVCPDLQNRRTFDMYWRLTYPGNAAVRGQWLAAVRRRTERSQTTGSIPSPAGSMAVGRNTGTSMHGKSANTSVR